MMMQMLEAGGIPVFTDNVRKPDEDNPKGYYELEKAKHVADDASWMDEAEGKAFKMVSMLLYDLPADRRFKVIFMTRRMEEILASQAAMLNRTSKKEHGPNDAEMKKHFELHMEKLGRWLDERKNMEVLRCSYNAILDDPSAQAGLVERFLDRKLDIARMAAVVAPELHRHRT